MNPKKYTKTVWHDFNDKTPPKGFPKVAPEDRAPEVKDNPITGYPDRLPAYSNEQKARMRRRNA